MRNLGALLLNDQAPGPIVHRKTAEVILEEGKLITQDMIEILKNENVEDLIMPENEVYQTFKKILHEFDVELQTLETQYKTELNTYEKEILILKPASSPSKSLFASKRKLASRG